MLYSYCLGLESVSYFSDIPDPIRLYINVVHTWIENDHWYTFNISLIKNYHNKHNKSRFEKKQNGRGFGSSNSSSSSYNGKRGKTKSSRRGICS